MLLEIHRKPCDRAGAVGLNLENVEAADCLVAAAPVAGEVHAVLAAPKRRSNRVLVGPDVATVSLTTARSTPVGGVAPHDTVVCAAAASLKCSGVPETCDHW